MDIIQQQYPQLKNGIYLDYAGAMTLASAQNAMFGKLFNDNFANVHSKEQVSLPVNQIEDLRSVICSMFGTNTKEYSVVFTQNTTHSLQILGNILNMNENTKFYYLMDNHNSVFGLRTAASRKNAKIIVTEDFPEGTDFTDSFFAFPSQSNFSGRKYPLDWISNFQSKGGKVILDAACSYCPSLEANKPDFVSASLLKLVGIHAGILLIKNSPTNSFSPLPAGGTVNYTCPRTGKYDLLPSISQQLEAGTPSYINLLIALEGAKIRRKIGTEKEIEQRIYNLSHILEAKLKELKHSNGVSLVQFQPERDENFGGTFSFNLYTQNNKLINHHDVQYCFSIHRVAARFGGHCNPGCAAIGLHWEDDEIVEAALSIADNGDKNCLSSQCVIDGKPIGTIRFSLGATSTEDDINRIISLLENQFINGGPCKDLADKHKISDLKIEKLFVYPVVGTLGFEVNKWTINDRGMKYDRTWKLVNGDGNTVNLTACTELCKVVSKIEGNELVLVHDNGEALRLPIDDIDEMEDPPVQLKKHGIVYKQFVADWFFKNVGRFLYLVKVGNRDGGRMAFSSVSQATYDYMKDGIELERLRVNIFFSGCNAFEEQNVDFNGLKLNGIPVIRWRPRVICMMATIKPHDGTQCFEPFQKLSETRAKYGTVEIGSLFSIDCKSTDHEISVGDFITYN